MKAFKIIFTIGLVLVMGSGCKVLQPDTHAISSTVAKDSTHTQITERFIEVFMPGDTVFFTQMIDCPEETQDARHKTQDNRPTPFKQAIKGKRSSGSIEVDKTGRLMASFNCDALRDSVKVRDTEISRLLSSAKTDSTIVTVHVKFIPKVYKASMWFSSGILLLVLLWCVWKGVKMYFKPF